MFWLQWEDVQGVAQGRFYFPDIAASRYLEGDATTRQAMRGGIDPPTAGWTLEEPDTLAAFETARTAVEGGTATDAQVQTYLAYLGP
jgi:hypothetical protein